jgi:hypothetical protein
MFGCCKILHIFTTSNNTDMATQAINQLNSLNRKARVFLLDHCVSKKGAEIMAIGFIGYINGQYVEDTTLIRYSGQWQVFATHEAVVTIAGEIDCFFMTRNTVLQ